MLLNEEEIREDPRVIRTRNLLSEALLELVMEKSFQNITIQEIADRATVNRVTFYAHFQDKFALLEYSFRELFKKHLQAQLPKTASFTPDNLATLIRSVCEFLKEMTQACPPPHGQLDALMEKQIKEMIYEVLLGWLGTISDFESIKPQAMISAWAIYGAAVQWSQMSKQGKIDSYVQQVLPIIQASLNVQMV